MEIRGYKRIKKKDIKRWFKGSNLIVYILILLLLLLILLFAFKTIVSMHNDNVSSDSDESADTTEEDSGSTTEESAYIAKNQSYKIRINVSRNIAIIYSIGSNNGFDNVVKAFYVSVNSNINTGDTFISEKAEWRKLDITGYGHYSTRLNNSEYICSSAYFTKTVGNMNIDEYNKMGTSASSGSIYMTPADAKWIYNNCGVNTQVQIENDFDIPSSVNITEFKKYNYVVVNDDLCEAVEKVKAILKAEKCRVDRIEEIYLNTEEEKIHEDLIDKEFENDEMRI